MKSIMSKLLLLFIQPLLYLTVTCKNDVEWVDPFKIDIADANLHNGKHNVELIDPFKLDVTDANIHLRSKPNADVMAYYKRTINLILSSVIVENSDLNTYKGRLFVDIPLEDYKFLKKFCSAYVKEPLMLREVDQILTNIFTKSTVDELSDVIIYWSDYIYFMAFNRATGVYLTVAVVLIVIYKLLKASYTPYQIVIYLSFLGYLLDFVFTWKRMLQGLEINKYADSMKYSELPADCKVSEMSGWKFLLSFISSASNCREYHKIILYDVFWDVGPLDVMAHQSRVILEVAGNVGMALSKLTVGLMSGLPFPLNIILLPLLLLFTLLLLWTILTYLTETHIDLNLFHLINVKFKTNQSIKNKSDRREFREQMEEVAPPMEKRKIHDKRRKDKKQNAEKVKNVKEEDISTKTTVIENVSFCE